MRQGEKGGSARASTAAEQAAEDQDRLPALADVHAARERILPHVHRTPVLASRSLDRLCGSSVFLKCENLQRAGAFKFRGACNAVLSLRAPLACLGVATHSSGNHAAALALAARVRGIRAYVVMPRDAAAVKRRAVAGYGAEIFECEPTLAAREEGLAALIRRTGAAPIHPYNDPAVIAGQGTAALELLEEVPDLECVLAPLGGGGLLSGTAIAVRGLAPEMRVIGVEPEGADDAFRSLRAGVLLPANKPQTIADGLRTSLGTRTFRILRELVDEVVTVPEEAIVGAMRWIWERLKIVIEPSAAVAVAALLSAPGASRGRFGARVGVIVSGGNVDLDRLPWAGAD